MDADERFNNMSAVNNLIDQTGVKSVWDLDALVEQHPPSFDFDTVVGYSILGIVAMSTLMVAWPVGINKTTISEMYTISMDEVNEYFEWFCQLGILRSY